MTSKQRLILWILAILFLVFAFEQPTNAAHDVTVIAGGIAAAAGKFGVFLSHLGQ